MAAVRHLEFAKIAILDKWPISACDSSSRFRNLHKSADMAPRYSKKKTIFNMASVRYLEFENFPFLSNLHARNGNLYLRTKFDRNRIILGWDNGDNAIFENGGRPPSRICENCSFGHVTYIGMRSFISVPNFALIGRRRDIAKKRFSIWRPSAILDLLWRHHIASENCISRSQLCVKFSRRSVS